MVAASRSLTLFPRPIPGAADEPLVVVFDKDKVKEIRGAQTKRKYPEQALEPELITYLFDESREKRRHVKYEELPEHLVKAVLAIEDRRFFTHPGLDPFRIVGAALRNIRAESYLQGGSTITQQLCKNFFLTPERTWKRKMQEAILAFVLERRASKQDILELYLNEIYLGQAGSFSINGVGQAARLYFHKDVANLTLPESAFLAGLIQSPNPYNPYRHLRRATERRNVVIRAMSEAGFIDEPDDGHLGRRRPSRSSGERWTPRTPPTSWTSSGRSSPSATTPRTSPPRTSRSTRRSTSACRPSPRPRSRGGWTSAEKMIKRKGHAARPGLPDRARPRRPATSWRSWAAGPTGPASTTA